MSDEIAFEIELALDHAAALEAVYAALKEQGFGVLTRIDVDKTLKEKLDVDFRPYTILGACNPPLAHKALSHNAQVGLMLPCNVTVEANGAERSTVRIANPDIMVQVGDFAADSALQEVAAEAGVSLRKVASALKK